MILAIHTELDESNSVDEPQIFTGTTITDAVDSRTGEKLVDHLAYQVDPFFVKKSELNPYGGRTYEFLEENEVCDWEEYQEAKQMLADGDLVGCFRKLMDVGVLLVDSGGFHDLPEFIQWHVTSDLTIVESPNTQDAGSWSLLNETSTTEASLTCSKDQIPGSKAD